VRRAYASHSDGPDTQKSTRRTITPLLHDVRELVLEQPSPRRRTGSVLALGDDDVASHSVGEGIDRAHGFGGARLRVDAHVAKVADCGRGCGSRPLRVRRSRRRCGPRS
jgi:hypothetical protein